MCVDAEAGGAQSAGGMAAVKGVQVRSSGSQGGYQDLTNKWGSAWEIANAPSYPLDVNIIGADGDAVRRLGSGSDGCIPGPFDFTHWAHGMLAYP